MDSMGSHMEPPGEKGAKIGLKPPQDTPGTSQDVQWIENGIEVEDKCLGLPRIPQDFLGFAWIP